MLEPPRNRHSVKVVSGMVLKGEERGRELWADLCRNARKTPKRKEKWNLTEKKNFSG